MTTLPVNASGNTDFRGGAAETNIDRIEFQTPGPGGAAAFFEPAQFGPGLISNSVHVVGDDFTNQIAVVFSSAGSFSAAGWTFDSWGEFDSVFIDGTPANQTITGSSKFDIIRGDGGVDQIDAGDGDDNVQITRQ